MTPPENTTETPESRRRARRPVTIQVSWGNGDADATVKLTRSQWHQILAGTEFVASTWSWYEGKRQRVVFSFNDGEGGRLTVGGDDCAEYFRGTLTDALITGAEYPAPPPDAIVFRVLEGGTLWLEGVELPASRAEAYDLALGAAVDVSRLVNAADDCEPLAWYLESERENAEGPEDLTEWLESLSSRDWQEVIRGVRQWLLQKPDWADESDHIPPTARPQGAALEFFRDWDSKDLAAIGVKIVEGEHPGSSYYAAELRLEPAVANAASMRLKLGVWFRKEDAGDAR